MAGISHLQEIYKKKGREFIDKLFDSYVTINEKLDACLKDDTLIQTEDGIMTIKDIVDNQYKGKIISINLETGEIELDKIVRSSKTEDKMTQWYEIKTKDGQVIIVTGNHKIWIPSLNCWRRVDDLDGTEDFLMKK